MTETVRTRVRASGLTVFGAVVALVVFLFAVQLLGAATAAAADPLERLFRRHVAGGAPALGASWLATYALMNGSVVAALSVSLFDSAILSSEQLFLMLAGSRLGGAAIVLLIGAIDWAQKAEYDFAEATSLGTLTFLLSHSIYLPATGVGLLLLPHLEGTLGEAVGGVHLPVGGLSVLDPVTDAVVGAVGAVPAFVLAVTLLFVGLSAFDRVLKRVDTAWLRRNLFQRFRQTWTSFALGLIITAVTTSVAFSLGVIVPLYNRRYVTRDEIVPYVLGANIGTFGDTLLIAILLGSARGTAVVSLMVALGTLVTVAALVRFPSYYREIDAIQSRIVADRRVLFAFLSSLVIGPLVLLVVPM
ncbi:MAG: sodium:phosphate symporter [Halobacteriales archaeon]